MRVLSSRRVVISVDYGKTLKQLIKEAKFYLWPKMIRAKNFPLRIKRGKKEKVLIKLFSFGPGAFTETSFQEIAKKRWRQLDIREALTLAAQHPDLLIERPVVVCGVKIRGQNEIWQRCALYIYGSACGSPYNCSLQLVDWNNTWDELFRFAGARKARA